MFMTVPELEKPKKNQTVKSALHFQTILVSPKWNRKILISNINEGLSIKNVEMD